MTASTILDVQSVCKRFGGLVALSLVSFQLWSGEILGVIGPNGAGKTTLFNVISGACRPDSGRIFLRGCDITRLSPHERCWLGIARTFQTAKPFRELSLLDNLTVGAYFGQRPPNSLSRARKEGALLLDVVGLGAMKDELAGRLTVAQRKKLELARALSTNPRVLLLDELLAGMGELEALELLVVVRRLAAEGLAVLMVEHIMKAMMGAAQRVLVLDRGQVIASGSPTEVVNDEQVVAVYLGGKGDVTA